jgi:hypothetical protein
MDGALEGAQGICVRGFNHWRDAGSFIVLTRVIPGNGQIEEGKVLGGSGCSNTRGDTGASACGEVVGKIIQDVSVGGCRVGKHFVRKDFCIDRHKGKVKAQTARRFRECGAI